MKHPDIFILIQSLSPSEKRYFKLFASQQVKEEKNAHIKLYDLLEKLNAYNEEKVNAKLKSFGDQKQIAAIKTYLYNLILKSLRNYYAETSTDLILSNFLQEAEILFERGMIEQCDKILDKAIKMALGYEKFVLLVELYNRKERILFLQYTREIHDKQIGELQKSKDSIRNKSIYHSKLAVLGHEVFSVYKIKLANRDDLPTDLATLENRYKVLIKEGEDNPEKKSILSQNHINYIQFLLYWIVNDTENAFEAQKKHLEFMELNFTVFEDRIGNYISVLHNFMDVSFKMNRIDLFNETLQKLKKLADKLQKKLTEQQNVRVFKTITFAEYNWYMHSSNFTDAAAFTKSVIEQLPLYINLIGEDAKLRIYSFISYVFFGNAQLKESLFWLNKFVNETDSDIRPDLQIFSRMLRLLIFYENKNMDLLEHSIKSFQKYISKNNTSQQYEILVIALLKKLVIDDEPLYIKKTLEYYRTLFTELKNDKKEANAFIYFDIIAWIDSKLEGKTFAEIKRR